MLLVVPRLWFVDWMGGRGWEVGWLGRGSVLAVGVEYAVASVVVDEDVRGVELVVSEG